MGGSLKIALPGQKVIGAVVVDPMVRDRVVLADYLCCMQDGSDTDLKEALTACQAAKTSVLHTTLRKALSICQAVHLYSSMDSGRGGQLAYIARHAFLVFLSKI
eukprot:1161034-Pelagomonas_calceolata.AAC.5